ncbi:MAG: excisionase family DNA binding protein [Planctomycetota bacterium]|jgi:excisionase family DNA binding protein
METTQLLTLSEVSKMLKVHPNTLRQWDNNGSLPAIRFGVRKIRRYRGKDIESFIKRNHLPVNTKRYMKKEDKTHEYMDITQHEIEALKRLYNLADAHTHQSQSKSQQENIVDNLPALWGEAEQTRQVDMEDKFMREFFRVAKQEEIFEGSRPLLVYASSIAMVMVANYLMKKNMTVALIEPCFDNIHDILAHMNIPMQPLREEWLQDPKNLYENLKQHITSDAIFIVDPNNPTGSTLFSHGDKAYKELIRFALDHNKLLLFDFCFAPFVDTAVDVEVPSVYKLLNESGVSYVAIEDTGKIWPLQDTKVAMLKASSDIYSEIYDIHTAYLLNVSPFILNLVTQYVLDSEKDNFDSVYNLLDTNREVVKQSLDGSLLEYIEPQARVSVAWFKIRNPKIKATALQKHIVDTKEVYVLPGTYFFWSDPSRGESYIRVALARDTKMFSEAISRLSEALENYPE